MLAAAAAVVPGPATFAAASVAATGAGTGAAAPLQDCLLPAQPPLHSFVDEPEIIKANEVKSMFSLKD